MEQGEIISCILQSAPGERFCDPCLAFALELPLLAVATIVERFVIPPAEYVGGIEKCDSCERVTRTTGFVPSTSVEPAAVDSGRKCVRCSHLVPRNEEEIVNGDSFHRQCWASLRTELQTANSRQMATLSQTMHRSGSRHAR